MSTDVYSQLDVLIRARYPIIYITSFEEARVEEDLVALARQRREGHCIVWSCSRESHNACDPEEKIAWGSSDRYPQEHPMWFLQFVRRYEKPGLFLIKDIHPHFQGPDAPTIVRELRELAAELPNTPKNLILMSPALGRLPMELEKDVAVVNYPLPTMSELGEVLDKAIEANRQNPRFRLDLDQDGRDALLSAALGLTRQEAENVFYKAIVEDGTLNAGDVALVLEEKKQIIQKSGILSYEEPEEELTDVGGLEVLKQWLETRKNSWTEAARDYGLRPKKGILLLGVPGCGKSLMAKVASKVWRQPLLRFDVGRIFGSLVGQSEEGMRRAIETAEAVAPAILWVDEIEKGFAGTKSSDATDSGVTARVFATFLTWMQEKTKPVFVVATANEDVRSLPPELLRKGRFDELFFVDLPTHEERIAILEAHLKRKRSSRFPEGRDASMFDLQLLSTESEGYTGAELEEAINSAMDEAFADGGREMTTDGILRAIRLTFPLSATMRESIEYLRDWAKDRARPASRVPEPAKIPESPQRRAEF